MAQPALIGIDLGTTGAKVGVCTPDGTMLSVVRNDYPMDHNAAGVAEQDPSVWWSAVADASRRSLHGLDVVIEAITVAGQGPTLVAADADGAPVRPAICWMDTRAYKEQVELSEKLGVDGFLLGNLPKIAWMESHEPALADRARWYLSAWDYVTMQLSGRAVTSMPSTGSQATPEMAEQAGLDPEHFPEPVPWGTVVGRVTAGVAEELGISTDCRVVAGANDALASYAGSGVISAGQSINNAGTSGGFAVYWSTDTTIEGVYSIPAIVSDLKLFGGAMSATGLSLDWVRRVAAPSGSLKDLLAEAAAVPSGAGGLVYLPYLVGERSPLWDADARGAFVGLEASHGRGHLVRAVLEAAGYAIRHVAEPIQNGGVIVAEMRPCGGGARSELWNQIKADVTGFPIAVPETIETAVLGAGILGALGIGYQNDLVDAMKSMVRVGRRYEPDPDAVNRHDELYGVYRDLYPALKPVFGDLADYRTRGSGRDTG